MRMEQDKTAARLLRAGKGKKAVAFDVFDTLLLRDVANPVDLFRLVGARFAQQRVQAEALAREKCSGEVTLTQIYAEAPLVGYDPAVECALELQAAVANDTLLRAAKLCHKRGQAVYAVSDMYLPAAQITAMLKRCGFDFLDGVFVSCEYGVQKRSGKLFQVFLQQTGLRAQDVLFVGDSWRADVLGAGVNGIRALHWPARSVIADSWQAGALAAFVQNRTQWAEPTQESLGFGALGPLLVAFVDWLHTQRSAAPDRTLYFLARDMDLVYEIYRRRYPQDENVAYLRVSRRSLCPALLAVGKLGLLRAALPRQVLTGAELAAYCGAICPAQYAQQRFDLKADALPQDEVAQLLAQFQTEAEPLATAYLRQMQVGRGAYLADIGSGGTTQRMIEALVGAPLQGLYLACDARLHTALPQERAAVYLFEGQPAPRVYWAGQPVLERLISQECGTAAGYRQDADGVKPVMAEPIPGPGVAAFRRGAIHFAKVWQDSVLTHLNLPPEVAIAPFLRLMDAPTMAETTLLGDIQVEDGGRWPLAAPRTFGDYLRKPGRAKADFRAARWKVGFLKRLLPLPLPYGALYRAAKK